jgi:hypothetical protein
MCIAPSWSSKVALILVPLSALICTRGKSKNEQASENPTGMPMIRRRDSTVGERMTQSALDQGKM